MSDDWVVWYGYRSVILRSKVPFIAKQVRPTGSNMYMIQGGDIKHLPPSHVPITIKYQEKRLEDIAIITSNLIGRVNEFLIARGSVISVVDDMLYDGNVTYTAIFADGSPITIALNVLNQLRSTIESSPDASYLGDDNEDKTPHNVFNEAPITMIPVKTDVKGNKLWLEYIAKNAYIFVVSNNQWLKPYANRVGWKSVDSIGRNISSISVPYFDENDVGLYEDFLLDYSDHPFPKSTNKWKKGHLRLSDGKWYPYHPLIIEYIDVDIVLPSNKKIVSFMDAEYELSELVGKTTPEYDWRLLNLSRVWVNVCDGLLPFKTWYPIVTYDDASERITILESDMGKAVVLNPGNYMIGLFPPKTKTTSLEKIFRDYWKLGYMLTNHGHFAYEDAYSAIDEMDIVFIGRNVTD